jgi:transketolase
LLIHEALEAAKQLKQIGTSVRVINMSSIKPIDKEAIIKAAEETGAIVTAEEHSIYGGLGSRVAEVLSENRPTLMFRIGTRDVFGQSGDPQELLKLYGLTAADIIKAAQELIKKK